MVHSETGLAGDGEKHDFAEIQLLSLDGGVEAVRLDLQAAERAVAVEMLDMLRDAVSTGGYARVLVDSNQTPPLVIQVAIVDQSTAFGRESGATVVSGFVESLGLIPLAVGGAHLGNIAWARFTTAPEFTGPGNTVDPAAFAPQELTLLVPESSPTYELVCDGLQDNLRMRVALLQPSKDGGDRNIRLTDKAVATDLTAAVGTTDSAVLTLAAELLAPLASASRPVWIMIDRDMIDKGPDADCAPGLPVNDLSPQGLRDLRIPYTARWRGLGCFNRGVYRIELSVPGDLTIELDDAKLCVYDSTTPGTRVAYACIEGDHWLSIEIANWTCDNELDMDVYRIR
jgi:hypothetical protein